MTPFTTVEATIKHMQSGDARIGVHSLVSNNTYTYHIKENLNGKWFFVNFIAITGEHAFMGLIKDGLFQRTEKSRVDSSAPAFCAFSWLWATLCEYKFPDPSKVRVYALSKNAEIMSGSALE